MSTTRPVCQIQGGQGTPTRRLSSFPARLPATVPVIWYRSFANFKSQSSAPTYAALEFRRFTAVVITPTREFPSSTFLIDSTNKVVGQRFNKILAFEFSAHLTCSEICAYSGAVTASIIPKEVLP